MTMGATRRSIAVLLALGLSASCDEQPRIAAPAAPTPTLLIITPQIDTLLIGQSAALSAFLTYSDGTGNTAAAGWRSDNPNVLSIDGGGALRAVTTGVATITATAQGATASLTVRALPAFSGNWRVVGPTVVECLSAHADGCTNLNAGNPLVVAVVLAQTRDRVTGQLGSSFGVATLTGTIGLDGVLSLQGETETTQQGVTYVAFRVSNWRTTVNAGRLSGRATLWQAEFPEWRVDPRNPTRRVTVEFQNVSQTVITIP